MSNQRRHSFSDENGSRQQEQLTAWAFAWHQQRNPVPSLIVKGPKWSSRQVQQNSGPLLGTNTDSSPSSRAECPKWANEAVTSSQEPGPLLGTNTDSSPSLRGRVSEKHANATLSAEPGPWLGTDREIHHPVSSPRVQNRPSKLSRPAKPGAFTRYQQRFITQSLHQESMKTCQGNYRVQPNWGRCLAPTEIHHTVSAPSFQKCASAVVPSS
jgi:hypothetical protein